MYFSYKIYRTCSREQKIAKIKNLYVAKNDVLTNIQFKMDS